MTVHEVVSASTAVAEVSNLGKTFRDFWHRPKVCAVDGVSFSVHAGEVFGLLGPNGSGKSTTIKILLGLLHAGRGEVRLFGESPRAIRVKARIGYLPEESHLYRYLTARETLDFYARLFGMRKGQRTARCDELLELVGLRDAANRPVGEFSKGMARRIGLAQALLNDPEFLVLDEPTAGLDPVGCRQVKDLLLTLARKGKTILLCSHLLADVEDVCDRIAILHRGRLRAIGRVDELLQRRDTLRVTIPGAESGASERVSALLRDHLGCEPAVEHPRVDLETFFLDVVKESSREAESGESTEA